MERQSSDVSCARSTGLGSHHRPGLLAPMGHLALVSVTRMTMNWVLATPFNQAMKKLHHLLVRITFQFVAVMDFFFFLVLICQLLTLRHPHDDNSEILSKQKYNASSSITIRLYELECKIVTFNILSVLDINCVLKLLFFQLNGAKERELHHLLLCLHLQRIKQRR